MYKGLDKIKRSINLELSNFNKTFDNILRSGHPLLKYILQILINRKGKLIRPIFVILTAKLNGDINQRTYLGASLIELLHSATLVHDDVIDNSELRRGFFSIKSIWGNKIAVLIGDYLLAKGLIVSIKNNIVDLLEIITEAVEEMVEGELLQLKRSRLLNINEEEYYEIIKKKTATLIGAAGSIGAKSVNAKPEIVQQMKDLGLNLGIAFQIRDDILDLQKASKTGKSFANDIREKKITLPLIKTLYKANNIERKKVRKILTRKKINSSEVKYILNLIEKYKGIELAEKELIKFKNKALKILENYEDTEIKENLKELIIFSTDRNY